MNSIIQSALHTLTDPEQPSALRNVACTTLMAAFEQRVDVPASAAMAVWQYLLHVGHSQYWSYLGDLPGEEVPRAAIQILRDASATPAHQNLAFEVATAHPRHTTDEDLLAMVEPHRKARALERLCVLIESVHDERGLSPQILHLLMDHYLSSPLAQLRAVGVRIAALLDGWNDLLLERLIRDTSPRVRVAVTALLEQIPDKYRQQAITLARRQLARETDASVVAALHLTLGALVR